MFLNKVEICGVNTSELPLLSNEEKENLFLRIERGDKAAREKYVKGNLRLVLSVIQRFSNNHEHADDLFQVGCIGLMKAVDNFDRSLDVKFSTYAVPMILGEVRRYLRDNNSIRVSRSLRDTAYKAIGQMLTLVEKKAVKEHEISKRRKSAITECADAIRDLQKQYEQLKAVKLRLYEKYTSGSITKAEYLKRKAETDAKMSENEEAIQQGHQRMQELDSEHPCSDERLDAVLGEYQKGAGLTYELAHALISAIYIHGHDSIEIVWQFKDIFEDAEI